MQKELRAWNESLKRSADDLGETGRRQEVEKGHLEKMSDEMGEMMSKKDELDKAQAELTKKQHERAQMGGARDAYAAKAEEMRVAQRLKDITARKTDEAIARGRAEAVQRRQEQKRKRDAFNRAQSDVLRDMQRVGDVEQVINLPRAPEPKPVVAPVVEKEALEEKASEPPVQRQPAEDVRGLVTNLKLHGKLRGLENPLDIRGSKRQKAARVPLPRNVPLPAATGTFTPVVAPRRPAPRRAADPVEEKVADDPVAEAASRIRPPLGDDRDLDDLANKLDDKPEDVIPENNPVDDNTYNYPNSDEKTRTCF